MKPLILSFAWSVVSNLLILAHLCGSFDAQGRFLIGLFLQACSSFTANVGRSYESQIYMHVKKG